VGRDSSVGIATRYGLDGPGIESRWRRDFQRPSSPALGPTQPPVQWGPGNGVKRPGRGVDHPPPSSAEVKERVELYLYSSSRPSWPVQRRLLPLPLSDNVYDNTVESLLTRNIFTPIRVYAFGGENKDNIWKLMKQANRSYAHIKKSTASINVQKDCYR
jgi:hypothetical protein